MNKKDFQLDDAASFRVHRKDWVKFRRVVKKNPNIYRNESHFIRAAIIQLLRAYDEKGAGYRKRFNPERSARPLTVHEIIKKEQEAK